MTGRAPLVTDLFDSYYVYDVASGALSGPLLRTEEEDARAQNFDEETC